MKYLCLVIIDEKKLDALPVNEAQALDDLSIDYAETLRRGNHLLAAHRLEPMHAATTVRVRNGKVLVTDGPFAETNEVVGGFLLIEARDLNEAIQLAAKMPSAYLGGIEIRPVRELAHSTDPNRKV